MWLQVAVANLMFMQNDQSFEDLRRVLSDLRGSRRPLLRDVLCQISMFEIFHRNIERI